MKKIKKAVLTIAVLSLTSSICAGLDFDKPMYDCGSYGEYFMSCSRTLPNGEIKYTPGNCSYSIQVCCSDGKWSEADELCK